MFKKYLVYGLGISGLEAVKFLLLKDFLVLATDDNQSSIAKAQEKLSQSESLKVKFISPDDLQNEIDDETAIIFSPGIPLHFPKRHKILEIVAQKKAKLMCDIELFYLFNSSTNYFIGITGTNGKSTGSALTDFILNEIGASSKLAGNIGIPVFELMQKENSKQNNFVLEVSSYQLELMSQAHFNVSALSNITIDHIERHGNFENYIAAKKRIFQNQDKNDYAVINLDNQASKEVYDNLKTAAKLIPFSCQKIVENGVAIIDQKIYNNIDENGGEFDISGAILRGNHNMENIAMAFACVYCLLKIQGKASFEIQEKIIDAIKKFKGLRHRMELLGEINGIKFINDSKATNAESTQNALESYDKIFWVLGGKAKEGGISILKPYFGKIIKAYLIGEASEQFSEILAQNNVEFEKCETLERATNKAFEDALKNDSTAKNIILSPACASFDQWKSFEERGDYFHKLFNEIGKK